MFEQTATKATPYKVDDSQPDHVYDLLDNGDIKVTQTSIAVSYWTAREFLTLVREHNEALEKTRYNYSKEFIESMKKQESTIVAELKILDPLLEKSEAATKVEYEKTIQEGLYKNLKTAISDKEFNINWWQTVWLRVKDEHKKAVLSKLDIKESKLYQKCLIKLKRKNIK